MKITDVTITLFAWDDIPTRQFAKHTGTMAGGRSELGLVKHDEIFFHVLDDATRAPLARR